MCPCQPDVVDLLEAAYRPGLGDEAWLRVVVTAARAFDQGAGVFAALSKLSPGKVEPRGFHFDGNASLERFIERVAEQETQFAQPFSQRLVTVGSLRQIVRGVPQESVRAYFAHLASLGIADLWGIGVTTTDGMHLSLCWPTPRREPPKDFARWSRTGLHLAAGLRLRQAMREHPGGLEPGAVLSTEGRILHIEGPSAQARRTRQRLSEGVRAVERARGAERKDPDRALSLWQGLVAGRFSLVDRIDSDGRRFVLALENNLVTRSPFMLADREREVLHWVLDDASNKEIAYALGLKLGTVSACLSRIMHKLHVQNRSELKVLALRAADWRSADAEHISRRHGYLALPLAAPAETSSPAKAEFTAGQRELLQLLADGLSNAMIAERLGRSQHTIRNRIAALSAKLGGRTRSELARWWSAL